MGSTMWMIELATNTITAESRIGSHKAVMGTIVPPGEPPLGSRKYLSGTRKSYAWAAELVKPAGDPAVQRKTSIRESPCAATGRRGSSETSRGGNAEIPV